MKSKKTDENTHGIANFAALKTAIANGEESLVGELLGDEAMPSLEKSYLIDLANLNGNVAILRKLKDVPEKD